MSFMYRWFLIAVFQLTRGRAEFRIKTEAEDFTGFPESFNQLTSTAVGAQSPAYQWYKNGTAIKDGGFGNGGGFFHSRKPKLTVLTNKDPIFQGIYQVFVSSSHGRIFGRETKVDFIVVGKFRKGKKVTLDVNIGESFQIPCPEHTLTKRTVYKWGGTERESGTWFYADKENVLVLKDGRLFFSHVTTKDVDDIKAKSGISCMLEGFYQDTRKFQESKRFLLNSVGNNTKTFGPKLEKIPDEEVVEGESFSLRCIAAGYPTPTYKWKRTDENGKTVPVFSKVGGFLLSELNRILVVKEAKKNRHAGTYTCQATIIDAGQTLTRNETSRVSIRQKPSWIEEKKIKSATPDILSQHVWKCVARGDPEPEYRWYANATLMQSESGRFTIDGGNLTFHQVSLEDNGMYQCTAKNKFGFAYQTVSMKVKVKAPAIQKVSHDLFIEGGIGVVKCESDGLPPATHSWVFGGMRLDLTKTTKYELRNGRDLVVHNLTSKDSGEYTCLAANEFGEDRKSETIKVVEIMFRRRPQNKTNVMKGDTFTMACEAYSSPPINIRYKWLLSGKELKLDNVKRKWEDSTHTLTVSNAQVSESGVYACVAYNFSEKRSSADVIVRGVPDAPRNLSVRGPCSKFAANLSWTISYRSPYEPLTRILIQWSVSSDSTTWYNVSHHVDGSANGYVVKNLPGWSDIVFRVTAVNANGMSKASEETARNECRTPAAKPTVCPDDVKGSSTSPKRILITWKEIPPLKQNGPGFGYLVRYARPNEAWQNARVSGDKERTFTISNTSADELWTFMVLAFNREGRGPDCHKGEARSAEEAKIMFTRRPQNKTDVMKGSTFSLQCEATSDMTLNVKYKWLVSGKEIAGKDDNYKWDESTHTLTVSNSRLKDGGIYECVAYVEMSGYTVKRKLRTTVIVRGLPDAPTNLAIQGDCSNFTANLSWTIAHRNVFEPITAILIQWSTARDSTTWYNVSDHVNGAANSHVIEGLTPGTEVLFRVIAINERGKSQPSKSTAGQGCKTAPKKPMVCPEGVRGEAKGQRKIEISWKAVQPLDQNGPDFRYHVSYRKLGKLWQQKEIGGSQQTMTIAKAGVNQLWEFMVRSRNSEGTGPDCSIEQARSANEAPSMAPTNFGYKELGAKYVILTWRPLNSSEASVLGYKLSFWNENQSTKNRRKRSDENACSSTKPCTIDIKNVSTSEYTLSNLQPYRSYKLELKAYNQVGVGPSASLSITTTEGRPGEPKIKVTAYGRYLDVTWRAPQEPNGRITGYTAGIVGVVNKTFDANTMRYLFEKLNPQTEYTVVVSAKTSAGLGDPKERKVNTTVIRVPAKSRPPHVEGISEDSVNVTYNASTGQGGFPQKFYVVYKLKDGDDKTLKETKATIIKRNGEPSFIVVKGLDNRKEYMFATIVLNEGKKSPRSEFVQGKPVAVEAVSVDTPIYRRIWFYILIAVVLLILLVLLVLLIARRQPKRVYKVGDREKKHGSVEPGEEHPLKEAEGRNEDSPPGKTYDPIEPQKTPPEVAASPPTSNGPALGSDPERDSLDEYEGEDDDFSEHGSFIGQYGINEKAGAPGSSPPTYV